MELIKTAIDAYELNQQLIWPLAAWGPASSAAQAIKAANLKQALASNTRAFCLADQAKRISQQKKQLQARQAMNKAQEKMRDAQSKIIRH